MLLKYGGLTEVMTMRFPQMRISAADNWGAPWSAPSNHGRLSNDWLALRAWEDDGGAELVGRGSEKRSTVRKERT